MELQEAVSVGTWKQDLMISPEARRDLQRLQMPHRYAQEHNLLSAKVKTELVQGARIA